MNFKYKTAFSHEIKASDKDVKNNKFTSEASLEQLKSLVPEDIDFKRNIDLIGLAFNAAVINQFNKNDDGIDTATAMAIKDYFVHKPTNIEHNKKKIVGHIVSSAFSRSYNDEIFDIKNQDSKEPFNLALGAVIYSNSNQEFADLALRSVNPNDELYQSVSASWELGFNDYVIAAGSRKLSEAEIITNVKHISELSEYLKAFDGEGEMKDGTPIYRLVVGEVYPLGIGFTANPAAEVKGIYIHKDKKKEIELDDQEAQEIERIEVDNKNFFEKSEKNISQNENLHVIESINKISTMEKKELLEDFKAILEEKMPGHDFSQETVANVGRVIGDAIKSKSEQYEKELRALEEHKLEFEKSEQALKEDIEDLRSKLGSAEEQVSKLNEEIEARKSEDAFNARMDEIDATYELSDEDRKVLVAEIQSVGLEDSDFEEYKSKLAVMWAHKNKEYIAEQEKLFNEKLEAEIQKRLNSEEVEVVEAKEEDSVEEVLENTVVEEEIVANNNVDTATEEKSLKEKFQQAFARENISIKI
jgi:hypothetical protein